ncbi:junctional adhesion molecule 2A isoform X2 [Conger conger]|uniref:junctional adhesion molecule 2A isoform X2 n=1 Tax=Conger conger TaxID=82655 RepID=UPI002A5AF077|nr:junctional adhesion molecule 2A isoform X2 [Conger conger]
MMEQLEICIFSAFLILLHSPSAAPVTVSSNRPRVEVPENTDAVLSCVFKTEKDNNPRIEWKKKGKDVSFVYFDGQFTGDFAGRAKMEGATVTLHRVTQKDTGEYRCEVSANQDRDKLGETNVTLKVLVPPHTPLCEIPSSAVTGSTVELRCRDKQSVPPAIYTWFKDNKKLSVTHWANISYTLDTNTGILRFNSVSRADTGQYHCLASNEVGAPKSCDGKHMKIDDVNISAIIAVVVVIFIILACCLGVYYAYRRGYFRKGHNGSNNTNYNPPQYAEDFKHTKSFML